MKNRYGIILALCKGNILCGNSIWDADIANNNLNMSFIIIIGRELRDENIKNE